MLNFFDPDKTHDILFAQRIKSQILTLLTDAISTKGIFDNLMPVALIERTAPGALNPWAEDWSGKMFEFLKPLSRTFILDDGYINGAAYGFEPEYQADLPDLIDLEAYHVDTLTVRVAPKTDGILTWLQRTHDEQSAPYCDKVTNKLTIAMRRSRVIRNQGNEPLEIELSTRNWLHNSVCFQNLELVGLSDQQSEFLLYDSMETFLAYLWGELKITDCRVLTGLTATQKKSFVNNNQWHFPWGISFSSQETIHSPIFALAPTEYHNAFLQKNDEKQGDITIVFDAQQEKLSLQIKYSYSYWDGWRESLVETSPYGYDLHQDPFSYKHLTVLDYALPLNPTPLQGTIATFKNNQPKDSSWAVLSQEKRTSYPPLDNAMQSAASGSGHFRTFYFDLNAIGEDFKNVFGGDPNYYDPQTQDPYAGIETVYSKFILGVYPHLEYGRVYWQQVAESGEVGDTAQVGDSVTISINLGAKTFCFFGAFDLFSDYETLIISADLQQELDASYVATFDSSGWGSNYRENGHRIIRRHKRKFASKIKVSYQGSPLLEPLILNNYIDHTVQLHDTDPHVFIPGDAWEPTLDYSIPVEVEVSAPVTRTLRLTPIEYPTLVVLDPSQADPANRTTIYYGTAGEIELETILYPDGPDGDPYLDPDTDGGDIMPDSVRIKEIHAALEAEKYGVHSQSTEDNPLKRLNNLGRLIEAASYVLGVNFNEDGENVPYPDPVLFDPDKIKEVNGKKLLLNAQFAVAEMNGGLDTSSLYEVRSAQVKSGRKGNEIDQRPHAVKYHNLQQLLDVIADDQAKQLGGGKNSAFQVPTASGDGYQLYEGVFPALADSLYMAANNSKAINELQNQSIKSIWLLSQILRALGVPCKIEKIPGVSGVYDKEGKEVPGYLPVPGLDPQGPTLVGLLGIVLMNLQQVVGGGIGFKTDEGEEPSAEDCEVTVSATPMIINAKDGGAATFTVTRTTKKPEDKNVLIYVNLMLNSTLGKAAFSEGFKPGLWSLDLQPGESTKAFSVKVEGGNDYKENHSITAILSGGEGYRLGVNKVATVAIIPAEPEEEEEEAELVEEDWKLEFELPDPAPNFVATPDDDNS